MEEDTAMLSPKMPKSIWYFLILTGAVSTFVACTGVSQNEMDRVSTDLDNARKDTAQLGTDLAMSESRIYELHHDLENISADLIKSQSEVSDLISKFDGKSDELAKSENIVFELQRDLEDTGADLIKSQSKVADLTSKLDGKSAELDAAKVKISEYSQVVEVDFPNLRNRTDQASLVMEIFNEFLRIGASGSTPDLQTSLNLFGKINDIEDDEIRGIWDLIMESGDTLSDQESGELIWAMLVKVEKSLK